MGNGIFNYDDEVNKKSAKKTGGARVKTKKENDNKKNVDSKKLNDLQKRKKRMKQDKIKEFRKQQKEEKKRQKHLLKKKLDAKQIKKIQNRRKIIKALSIIALVITAIVLFLISPIFNIEKIEINGNSKISENTIISLLELDDNTNIFKETYGEVNRKLKQNAYIESATVRRVLPSTLRITIKEREMAYQLEYADSFAYIDNKGYILEIAKEKADGFIKIQGYATPVEDIAEGNRLCDDDIKKMSDIYKIKTAAEHDEISDIITAINISNENDYIIYLESEQKMVHLGDGTSLSTKMLWIKKIIEIEKGKSGEIYLNIDVNRQRPYFKENV